MKVVSTATLAILASGKYYKVECYRIALANGSTFNFTAGDATLLVGGVLYKGGLTIVRGALTQKVGLDSQSLDLTIQPQPDYPGGPVTLNGQGFLSCCRSGALDGARITMYKGFFNFPAAGSQLDTSPGLVPWFQGTVNEIQAGRYSADITVNDDIELLKVQMPRNVLCAGCVHTLFDVGCTLNKAQNMYSGKISSVPSANTILSTLTSGAAFSQADGYFDLGVITFTSGVLEGGTYPIAAYLNAGGSIQAVIPWVATPAVGDTFTFVPGCDKSQATCNSNKFILPSGSAGSNGRHFRGAPYVPQPETLYDGGTVSPTTSSLGQQGGASTGSAFGGSSARGTYAK
jgi:hypothetical protein